MFMRLSANRLVSCEGQCEIFSRIIALESALGKAYSDLLAHQRGLSTLQDDIIRAEKPGPGKQVPVHLSHIPGSAQVAPTFPDVVGDSWMGLPVPKNMPPLLHDFVEGSRVMDGQDFVFPALFKKTATLPRCHKVEFTRRKPPHNSVCTRLTSITSATC